MARYSIPLVGVLLLGISSTAFAVADPDSVSIQDLRPECKERHPSVSPEHCMIDDRLSLGAYAQRFGGTVIIVEPGGAPPPAGTPSTNERPAPRETPR